MLGDHYGRTLESGEIKLADAGGEVVVRYYDHVAPIAPDTIADTDPATIARLNNDPDELHELLERQHYRLAMWTTAGHELNYRRFFAINELAALRMDNEAAFDAVHELPLRLVAEGRLAGLRVDHIDGLREPAAYLERLRGKAPDTFLVVEKILEPNEQLRGWPIEGTTGYDFLQQVAGIFIDPTGEKHLTDFYAGIAGNNETIEELKRAKKLLLMDTELDADVERLTELFVAICENHRRYRDYARVELRRALRETIAAFPVYRTYVDATRREVTAQDEAIVGEASDLAASHCPDLDPELFTFLADVLLLRVEGADADRLAARFQQLTGAVMAKGIEDTLFYSYNRFVALNEVGGDPGRFGISPEELHAANTDRQRRWPRTLNTTSTHDTKRGEDVRARLALLSETADVWTATVTRWAAMSARYRTEDMPDENMEYLIYQTLVGAWPVELDRMLAYVEKAAREAKEHTNWAQPDPDYEAALASFVTCLYADEAFMIDLEATVRPLVRAGRINSLGQLLLRMTSPGVPDVYQGTELWDLSLVDPDNRRPVDYEARRAMLRRVNEMNAADVWAEPDAGAPKLLLLQRALALRDRRPDAFGPQGSYEPLSAVGDRADNAFCYIRGGQIVVVCPRLVASLGGDWGDTTIDLPGGAWRDVLTGAARQGRARLADLLDDFPVALLELEGA